MLAQVFQLDAALVEADERIRRELLIGDVQLKAIAELAQGIFAHLFLLVGDVLTFPRLSHAIALDGLGKDDGWLRSVRGCLRISRIDLPRIVATTIERPDLVIRPVGYQRGQLWILAEEMLADVCPIFGFEILVLAVDALLHPLQQESVGVTREQLIP